mgnify:CR=1 FL=1
MQRISTTVRLNRSTLQFEEAAYQRLEGYLAEAARTLEGNPDQAEILADLEQAERRLERVAKQAKSLDPEAIAEEAWLREVVGLEP